MKIPGPKLGGCDELAVAARHLFPKMSQTWQELKLEDMKRVIGGFLPQRWPGTAGRSNNNFGDHFQCRWMRH